MANISSAISQLVEERLSQGVRESLPRLDPIYSEFYNTYMGVAKQSEIGRDWQAIHTFSESLSGALRWVAAGGSDIAATQMTHSMVPGAPREYPALDNSTFPGYLQKKIVLKECLGNMFVPQVYLRQDRLSAAIGNAIGDIIRGSAKHIALSEIAMWYALDGKKAICTVASGSASSVNGTNDAYTLVPVGGQVGQIHNGMHVDIYPQDGSGAKRNSVDVVVDAVRYTPDDSNDTLGYGSVRLLTKDGSTMPTITTGAVGTGDILVYRESFDETNDLGFGPTGPQQWLLDANDPITTVYNIDVAVHQQFQSIVATGLSQALDSTLLNKFLGRFFKAYGYADMPDCLVTSMGTYHSYLETFPALGSLFVTRQANETLTPTGGYDMGASPYVFNGRKMMWKISPNMPSKTDVTSATSKGGILWALKTREQNLKRYLPPFLPGSTTNAQFGREVEFVYAQGGPNGIFSPHHSTAGRKTDWQEAPWNRHIEIAPSFIQGIRLEGLAEVL